MPSSDDTNWGRFLGLGLQVLVGVVLGMLVGAWLDRKFGWEHSGVLIGMLLGLAAGMYSLIREGIKVNKD